MNKASCYWLYTGEISEECGSKHFQTLHNTSLRDETILVWYNGYTYNIAILSRPLTGPMSECESIYTVQYVKKSLYLRRSLILPFLSPIADVESRDNINSTAGIVVAVSCLTRYHSRSKLQFPQSVEPTWACGTVIEFPMVPRLVISITCGESSDLIITLSSRILVN